MRILPECSGNAGSSNRIAGRVSRLLRAGRTVLMRNWPSLLVVIVPLILFFPLTFGGRALFWGTPILQFYPWRKYALETVWEGHLPLWNPELGMGAPLIANYQSALLYPPNWLLLLLPLDLGLGWLAAAHAIFAGLGMVALARRLGLRDLGQAVSALSFSMSGYLVARMSFITINNTVAWLPWLLWAAEGLARWRKRNDAILLGVLLGLQLLAGHAQLAWYSVLLVTGWMLWRTVTGPRHASRTAYLRPIGLLLFSFSLALALAAMQLLPTAELLRQSPRAAGADYEFVTNYSFWPWRLITLINPNFFGSPANGDYRAFGNFWEDAVYIGLLPLLLAIGAMAKAARAAVRPQWQHHRVPLFLLGLLLVVSLLLGLGYHTPVFPFFYRYVPTFDAFQAPARIMVWFVLGLSLLAGVGADTWRRAEGRRLYWTRLGTAGAISALISSLLAVHLADLHSTFVRATAMAGAWATVAGVLALVKPAGDSRRWSMLAAAVVALDLIVAGSGLNPTVPVSVYRDDTRSGEFLRGFLQGRRSYIFEVDEQSLRFDRFFSFEDFYSQPDWHALRETQLPNLNLLEAYPSANNFDPLLPGRYAELLEELQSLPPEQAQRWLDLMNVGAILNSPAGGLGGAVHAGRELSIYPGPESAARARIVGQAILVPSGAQALLRMLAPDFDPRKIVVVEQEDVHLVDSPIVDSKLLANKGQVTIVPDNDPNKLVLRASLAEEAYILLSDIYYPGWVALLDGRPVPILRADFAFRAVRAGAGDHELVFQYRPVSFYAGSLISLAAWLSLPILRLHKSRSAN